MLQVVVKNNSAQNVSNQNVHPDILDLPFNQSVVYDTIKNQLANKRHGNAHSKSISDVIGSTKKPWRQKGTGRARAGTVKSPLWRSGAVTHGPKKKSFNYSIPKKIKRNALLSTLSQIRRENRLLILQDFPCPHRSTKKIASLFNLLFSNKYPKNKKLGLHIPSPIIYVMPVKINDNLQDRQRLYDSIANLPWLKPVNFQSLEVKDLYYAKEVVFSLSAFSAFSDYFQTLLPKKIHNIINPNPSPTTP